MSRTHLIEYARAEVRSGALPKPTEQEIATSPDFAEARDFCQSRGIDIMNLGIYRSLALQGSLMQWVGYAYGDKHDIYKNVFGCSNEQETIARWARNAPTTNKAREIFETLMQKGLENIKTVTDIYEVIKATNHWIPKTRVFYAVVRLAEKQIGAPLQRTPKDLLHEASQKTARQVKHYLNSITTPTDMSCAMYHLHSTEKKWTKELSIDQEHPNLAQAGQYA